MNNSLLAEIRDYTKGCHCALEEEFDVFKRVKSLDDYRTLLFQFYAIYSRFESQLKHWESDFSALGLNFENRRKLQLIESDLQSLGRDEDLKLAPACTSASFPEIKTFAQALGCLYVLEGSTLGGQIICKHLKALFESQTSDSFQFYQGYGPQTGLFWREFCQAVERYSEQTPPGMSRQEVLNSAKLTFDYFSEKLQASSPPTVDGVGAFFS